MNKKYQIGQRYKISTSYLLIYLNLLNFILSPALSELCPWLILRSILFLVSVFHTNTSFIPNSVSSYADICTSLVQSMLVRNSAQPLGNVSILISQNKGS